MPSKSHIKIQIGEIIHLSQRSMGTTENDLHRKMLGDLANAADSALLKIEVEDWNPSPAQTSNISKTLGTTIELLKSDEISYPKSLEHISRHFDDAVKVMESLPGEPSTGSGGPWKTR